MLEQKKDTKQEKLRKPKDGIDNYLNSVTYEY